MKRQAFATLALFSLLVCVSACVLWIRSFWQRDGWVYIGQDDAKGIWSQIDGAVGRGLILYQYQRMDFDYSALPAGFRLGLPSGPGLGLHLYPNEPVGNWRPNLQGRFGRQHVFLQFGYLGELKYGHATIQRHYNIAIPIWAIVLVSAAMPTAWFARIRAARIREGRKTRGECLRCGYDLRASGERCPECGTPVIS